MDEKLLNMKDSWFYKKINESYYMRIICYIAMFIGTRVFTNDEIIRSLIIFINTTGIYCCFINHLNYIRKFLIKHKTLDTTNRSVIEQFDKNVYRNLTKHRLTFMRIELATLFGIIFNNTMVLFNTQGIYIGVVSLLSCITLVHAIVICEKCATAIYKYRDEIINNINMR